MLKNYLNNRLFSKTINSLVFFLFAFIPSYAQQLSGLWMGELENDSTHKKQQFELALSEYRGKVTGYSYTTFIEEDHYYYSVKRIKAVYENDKWIISDDKMIANNFPEKAAKGVKQTTIFTLNKTDSTWQMAGKWYTNKTKIYYPLYGTMQMKAEKDMTKSNMFPHLGDLQIDPELSFYIPEKRLPSAGQLRANKESITKEKIAPTLKNGQQVKTTIPVFENTEPAPAVITSGNAITEKQISLIAGRKTEVIQTVYIESDSLTLSLYDNGEIDGDTVSVYLNGNPIITRECLKAVSNRKTFALPPKATDEIEMVLVAENLGLYPPNTGLLVIRDGVNVYQVRFSADFEKNPAIIFKRKKPQ